MSQKICKILLFAAIGLVISACGGGGSAGGGSGGGGGNGDTTPNQFSFVDRVNVALNSLIVSDEVNIQGINQSARISVVGGEYSIEGGEYISTSGTVTNGQSIKVRTTSSSDFSSTVDVVLTVGSVSDTFSVSTLSADTTPDEFQNELEPVSDVGLNTLVMSDPIKISGINTETPIEILNGEYSLDGGISFLTVDTLIQDGQEIIIRVNSAYEFETSVTATLTVGNVSGDFIVTTMDDTTPPEVYVDFPPAVSMTERKGIKIRGRAKDDLSLISSVEVAGVPAISNDGFASWTVDLKNLTEGENTLAVVATDAKGNVSQSTSISITQTSDLSRAFPDNNIDFSDLDGIFIDKEHERNRLIVLTDGLVNQIFTVDLLTGMRAVLSNETIPDAENMFASARVLAFDKLNDRAIVNSEARGLPEFIGIDLESGARSFIANGIQSEHSSTAPESIVVQGHTAYIVDRSADAVFILDLLSNKLSLLSDPSTPDNINPLSRPTSIAIDSANDKLMVGMTSLDSIYGVDMESGARTLFSNEHIPSVSDIEVDSKRERVIVADRILNALVGFNMDSGSRHVISDAETPYSENALSELSGDFVLDDNGVVFIHDFNMRGLFAIDTTNGERVLFSKSEGP